jgi:raffinose/stachyose/melibiose transport system permease protein
MAAFALSEYNFRGNSLVSLYLSIGIMIPIRLGTVSLLRLMVKLNLVNTLAGLILVYIAQGLPLTIFILSQFMRQVPKELKDAARIDGANEYHIYLMVLPLVRPALGAIGIFTMIPIWNDLWFPLVLAPSAKTATITLGVQQFLGQFVSDWNAVLASLSLAMIPILIVYLIFSQQMIRSITAGGTQVSSTKEVIECASVLLELDSWEQPMQKRGHKHPLKSLVFTAETIEEALPLAKKYSVQAFADFPPFLKR